MSKFVDNIAAGVDALGLENAPIIWALAHIQWSNPQERDTFFQEIQAYQPPNPQPIAPPMQMGNG